MALLSKEDLSKRNRMQEIADRVKQEVADKLAPKTAESSHDDLEQELLHISKEFFSSTNSFVQVEKAKWSENYDLYNSVHTNTLDANYTNPNYKKSKIFLPKTRQFVMSMVAKVINAYFRNEEIFYLTPEKLNDPIHLMACDYFSHLIDYRLRHTIDWQRFVIYASQGAFLHNFQIVKVEWDFEKKSTVLNPIAIENIRIHPGSNPMNAIEDSPCIIHVIPMFVDQIIERMNNEDEDIKWYKMEPEEIRSTSREIDNDYIVWVRNYDSLNPLKEGKTSHSEHNLVMVHENIVRLNNQDYVFYTLGKEKMLSKVFKLEDVYRQGRPFILGSAYLEEHRLFPTSPVQSAKPLQYALNKVTNMMFDNKQMAQHPRILYKKGSSLDLYAFRAQLPDTLVAAQNPQTDVNPLVVPDLSGNFVRDQQQFANNFDATVGSFGMTSADGLTGADSVGGLNTLQGSAGEISEMYMRNINHTIIEPTLKMILKVEQLYSFDDEELINKIFDMKGLFDKYGIQQGNFEVTKEFMEAEMEVHANCGFGAASDQMKLQNFIAATKTVEAVVSADTSNMLDKDAVIQEIFSLSGIKDASRFIKGGVDPQIQQLQQQIQQLQQELANKKPDPRITDAEVAIKNAEAQVKTATVDLVKAQTEMTKMKGVQTGTQAQFAAIQGAAELAQYSEAAAAADNILHNASDSDNFQIKNFETDNSQGVTGVPANQGMPTAPHIAQNTHPLNPATATRGLNGMNGMNTPQLQDNE